MSVPASPFAFRATKFFTCSPCVKPLYKFVEGKSCSGLRKVVPLLSDSITYLVSVVIFPIYKKNYAKNSLPKFFLHLENDRATIHRSVIGDGTAGFCLQFTEGGTDMRFEKIDCGSVSIAVVLNDNSSDNKVIADVDSALDLLMSAKYEAGTEYLVVDKKAVTEDFFVLSSGLAGEILQKYINYGGKLAIYGDYSHYTSKPLKDFIFESNKGKDFFFTATKEDAVQKIKESI